MRGVCHRLYADPASGRILPARRDVLRLERARRQASWGQAEMAGHYINIHSRELRPHCLHCTLQRTQVLLEDGESIAGEVAQGSDRLVRHQLRALRLGDGCGLPDLPPILPGADPEQLLGQGQICRRCQGPDVRRRGLRVPPGLHRPSGQRARGRRAAGPEAHLRRDHDRDPRRHHEHRVRRHRPGPLEQLRRSRLRQPHHHDLPGPAHPPHREEASRDEGLRTRRGADVVGGAGPRPGLHVPRVLRGRLQHVLPGCPSAPWI
mmetsp:Transcript_52681/g.138994  ORF Transcript_52681/g.138994 Transcript_52681/m.138994 type:complete len:263 (-) Transcript_52681:33-821(-)